MIYRVIASVLCVLSLLGVPAAAEPLRLSAALQRGFEQLEGGAEKLAKARAAVAALGARERLRGSPRDWEGLEETFSGAARTLQSADGPYLPDPPTGVPLEQLKACDTRATATARATQVVRLLQAGGQRLAETRALLRERRAAAQATDEAWRALVKALAALPDEPAVSAAFPTRWTLQELGVQAALSSAQQVLARQDDRLERALGEFRGRAATLSAAVAETGRAKDCLLAGQWGGASTRAGTVSGMTLELVTAGSGYTGAANLNGTIAPVSRVALSGASLVITLGRGGGTLAGTLSPDGRAFGGTFSSSEGPARFSLRRQ